MPAVICKQCFVCLSPVTELNSAERYRTCISLRGQEVGRSELCAHSRNL